MSTAEATEADEADVMLDISLRKWSSVVVASLVAGAVMGIPMQFIMGVMPTVGALYGWENLAIGWVAHIFHSVVFGAIFAGTVSLGPLREYAGRFPTSVGVGVGYGFALWIFGAVIAMPLWLQAAGLGRPGVPNINLMSLGGHVAYGALLGGLFPAVYSLSDELYVEPSGHTANWIAGAGGGFVAGVVMGIPMHLVMDIMPTVATLYGLEGVAAGWAGHLFHSTVFGVIFAGIGSLPFMRKYATFPTSVLLGIGVFVAEWVFGPVYAMPIWLSSIGVDAPPVPNIAPMPLLTHILFGAVLGLVYSVLLKYLLNRV